ncbi:MAG: FAD:protein FMN transferase [Planctomycetota bacterium]|jgi:thiamine biosynthesis lipoprotein
MRLLQRRAFLCATASVAAVLGSVGRRGRAAGAPDLRRVSRTDHALGSAVTLTALHHDESAARAALDAAFDELERVEDLMSVYRSDSQLGRLNATGRLDRPHPYLLEVLRHAQAVARRSRGAFDVTVQPLWRLYREAQRAGAAPSAKAIESARALVDYRELRVTGRRVELRRDGARVTLNGIAQGFAADRVMRVLRERGVEHAIIDTGEIAPLGARADGDPWKVGIQHPRRPDACLALAALRGRCLATSGDYATVFSDDHERHHLFDPRTGRSAGALASVSVVAPTAMAADALSTAVFVLGPAGGAELISRTPGADALLVTKDGSAKATPGFPATS